MRPMMDWYELRFRLQFWFVQSWLIRPIVWLRFLFVDKSKWLAEAREKSAALLGAVDSGKSQETANETANPMFKAETGDKK
jgi:hypothetical protein